MVLRPLLLFTASPATLWPHVCALSHFSHVLLFVTPYTAVFQAPLSMGILQARILEWVVMLFSRESSWPRDWTRVSYVSCIGMWVLYHLGSLFSSVQFISVAQLCPTLCNSMDCSTPGLPVHHQLPEFTQTHVRWVGDAIQPSHPLSSPSPPASYNLM